jgi:hypothetical protein
MNELKKEFEEKFLHGLKFHKSLAYNEIALEKFLADKIWQWIEKQIKDAGAKGFKRGYKAGVERSVLSSMSDEQT